MPTMADGQEAGTIEVAYQERIGSLNLALAV